MKAHYFNQTAPDDDDALLKIAIAGKHVPPTCLLGGAVLDIVLKNADESPCLVCEGPRARCGGGPKESAEEAAMREDVRHTRALFEGTGMGNDNWAMDKILGRRK